MSYTIIPCEGIVVRDEDGVIVAPCQSAEDPDFVAYCEYVNNGGVIDILDPIEGTIIQSDQV